MIYFDNAATTKVLPAALQKYEEVTLSSFGNASSNHAFGLQADRILEESRQMVLATLGLTSTHSLIFTSGATESNNLALKGVAFHYANRGKKIITSAIEHASVLKPLIDLRDHFGYDLVILPVNADGIVTPEELAKAMDDKTILVSLMAVNNEIGSLFPVHELAKVVHSYRKAFFHVDATQAICKNPIPYEDCDLVSFSGHKFGALKGTGGLLYKKNIMLQPQNEGGEQEDGLRAGTSNVAGAAALAVALVDGMKNMKAHYEAVKKLSDALKDYFVSKDGILMNTPVNASPYVINISLKKKKASVVVEALSNKGIYVSSVSACSSKVAPFSYVVDALTGDRARATNSIRLSFSYLNTMEEVKEFESSFDSVLKEVIDQ